MGLFGIKDKHALTDLAKFGTAARKKVHPDVLIGDYPPGNGRFREGDMLDANAVLNLILDVIDPEKALDYFCIEGKSLSYWLTKNKEDIEAEIERATGAEKDMLRLLSDFYDSVYTLNLTETNRALNIEHGLLDQIDNVSNRLDNVYNKEEVDLFVLNAIDNIPEPETINHAFVTQEQYDLLESYDKDTIYFVLDHIDDEPNSDSWHFGEQFPIVLTESESLGEFPIVLS